MLMPDFQQSEVTAFPLPEPEHQLLELGALSVAQLKQLITRLGGEEQLPKLRRRRVQQQLVARSCCSYTAAVASRANYLLLWCAFLCSVWPKLNTRNPRVRLCCISFCPLLYPHLPGTTTNVMAL